MTQHYTIEGLVQKLIGPVEPCGSHYEDQIRLESLKALCELNRLIIEKLCDVATTAHQGRAGMKAMSDYATNHLVKEVECIVDAKVFIKPVYRYHSQSDDNHGQTDNDAKQNPVADHPGQF